MHSHRRGETWLTITGHGIIVGTNEDDDIREGFGGASNDSVFARGGDDAVFAFGGNDLVLGEGGNDLLHGGSGTDTLSGGIGNDWLLGEDNNDRLEVDINLFDFGTDILEGNTGTDTISFDSVSVITVNGDPVAAAITPAPRGVSVQLSSPPTSTNLALGEVQDFGSTHIDASQRRGGGRDLRSRARTHPRRGIGRHQ